MLMGLTGFKPLIQPFPSDQLPAAEDEMREFRNASDFAYENVVNVRSRDTENLGDIPDGQNIRCAFHVLPHPVSRDGDHR